jgi:conserved oligomeric Golgi complex subunit 3
MEREQEEAYRSCLAEVEAYVAACDEVLEQLDSARGLIHEMDANYRYVEENSRTLQVACETLLEEQVCPC